MQPGDEGDEGDDDDAPTQRHRDAEEACLATQLAAADIDPAAVAPAAPAASAAPAGDDGDCGGGGGGDGGDGGDCGGAAQLETDETPPSAVAVAVAVAPPLPPSPPLQAAGEDSVAPQAAAAAAAAAAGAPPPPAAAAPAPAAAQVPPQGAGSVPSERAQLLARTARAQRTEYRTLVAALVADWEAELPCGVLLALEPTAADARAPHALGAARCERLHAAREAYAQAFAREGLRLEDAAG
jgi:hypothetical protein